MATRLYGITSEQIAATIEERGYTCSVRGGTIAVRNASGKRAHGEIFKCRDGGWDHRLDGNAVRIWESLSGIASTEAPATDAVDPRALREAIRAGNARSLGYTDEQIADAVRYDSVSQSDAMNQDD